MSNPTTPFSWQMPTATDLVTDLPADFEVFGQAVATSMADLLGGTSGQILAKNSNTDMDFVWIANDQGDITGITASSPLTGGGTSGAVTVGIQDALTTQKGAVQLSDSTSTTSSILAATPTAVKSAYDLAAAAIPKSTVTTAGDVIYATASSAVTRLGIGSAGQVLTVASGVPSWATPSSGTPSFVGCRVTNVADQSIANSTRTILTFDTETFDTNTFHDTSTNTGRMTIPSGKAGKYLVTAAVTFATNSTSYREIYLFKNGSFYSQVFPAPSGTGSSGAVLSDLVDLAVADYVEIKVEQGTGGALAVRGTAWGPGSTYFGITYLGA